jgi:hypothetical protein
MRVVALTLIAIFVASAGCGSAEIEATVTTLPTAELDAALDVVALEATPRDDLGVLEDADVATDASIGCLDKLKAEGISFEQTSARGVVDAVHVLGPIHGVLFASGTDTNPIGDPIACEFVLTLAKFADLAKAKGFVRLGTLGSYCYRCCCSWSTTNFCRDVDDPEPDCSSSGYSTHSWGRAVDIRYLYKADGTRYDINDPAQFVMYTTNETCTAGIAAQTGISKELYALACEATAQKIFGIVLTPNYNDAHRNHFHMDIGQSGAPTSWKTLSLDPYRGIDDATGAAAADRCGE